MVSGFCVEYVTASDQRRRVRYLPCADAAGDAEASADRYWRIIEAATPDGWRFVGRQRVTDLQWYLEPDGECHG